MVLYSQYVQHRKEKELLVSAQFFELDVPEIGWQAQDDPQGVLELVNYLRRKAKNEYSGPHNRLLNLICSEDQPTVWRRPQCVLYKKNMRYTRMKDWLAENGAPYVPRP